MLNYIIITTSCWCLLIEVLLNCSDVILFKTTLYHWEVYFEVLEIPLLSFYRMLNQQVIYFSRYRFNVHFKKTSTFNYSFAMLISPRNRSNTRVIISSSCYFDHILINYIHGLYFVRRYFLAQMHTATHDLASFRRLFSLDVPLLIKRLCVTPFEIRNAPHSPRNPLEKLQNTSPLCFVCSMQYYALAIYLSVDTWTISWYGWFLIYFLINAYLNPSTAFSLDDSLYHRWWSLVTSMRLRMHTSTWG